MKFYWILLITVGVALSVFTRSLALRAVVVTLAIMWAFSDLYLYTFARNTIDARAQKGFVPQDYVNGVLDAERSYGYIQHSVSVVLLIVLLITLRSLYEVYVARRGARGQDRV